MNPPDLHARVQKLYINNCIADVLNFVYQNYFVKIPNATIPYIQ